MIHKDVYDLFCVAYDKISIVVETEKITTVMECMVANILATPEESLK